MIYLERLNSTKFIEIIKDFQNCVISEKFDGYNIIFINDGEKIVFSRERKIKTKKFLTKQDFDEENPYHVPFISAFDFLERIKSILPKGKYEAEILFGKTPNVINYNFEKSKLIILHEFNEDDVVFDLQKFKNIKNHIFEDFYVNPLTGTKEKIKWELETNNIFINTFEKSKISNILNKLEEFLNQENKKFKVKNKIIEVAELNKKPYFVGNMKNWKSLLKKERKYIRSETEKYKKQICKIILEHFIGNSQRNKEGIVIYYRPDKNFYKIISPYFGEIHRKFAKLNRKYPFTKYKKILSNKKRLLFFKNLADKAWMKYVNDCDLFSVYDVPQKHYIFNLYIWRKILKNNTGMIV